MTGKCNFWRGQFLFTTIHIGLGVKLGHENGADERNAARYVPILPLFVTPANTILGGYIMAGLPQFTKFQQEMVIIHLINMIPHREIARHLQNRFSDQQFLREWGEDPADYEGWVPEGMSQQEYEQIVIKRCKDYVSNKDRKPYQVIKEGRQKFRDEIIDGIIAQLMQFCNIMERCRGGFDIKEAVELAEKTGAMRELIFAGDEIEAEDESSAIPSLSGEHLIEV